MQRWCHSAGQTSRRHAGAVHLTVTADAWPAPAADAEDQIAPPPLATAAGTIDVHADGDPMRDLRAARRPVILAGAAAVRCAAGPELVRLAERAGIPVVVSPMAKGVFAEDHPYFVGVLDMAGHRVLWDLLSGADLILAAGFDPVELISPWSVRTPVLHADTTPNTGVRVDTPAALDKALADLGERSSGARPLVVEARIDPAQYEVQF
jgi:acetolactate synthase I/II/III large subunit